MAEYSIQKFKERNYKNPAVKVLDPKKEVTLDMDTSERAVSVILFQEGHPILYLPRMLISAEVNY